MSLVKITVVKSIVYLGA